MNPELKTRFIEIRNRYFPGAELPLAFYFTNEAGHGAPPSSKKGWRCLIDDLAEARSGKALAFLSDDVSCPGGKRFVGFTGKLRPNFEYFLSCGIPGKLEGERYKKTPELVTEQFKHQPSFDAPGKYLILKRWDILDDTDNPLAVVFFAPPDVLSGLFTLANFNESGPNGVIAPFGSGCASIIYYPYQEYLSDHPRAVLGMFDVSARPSVEANVLTLAVPWARFEDMVDNVDESFLITEPWNKVRERINGAFAEE
jgi:hypothetical protein